MTDHGKSAFCITATLALATLISGCLTGDPVESTGNLTNNPPTINGTPGGAVLVGDTYSFTPNANDPDGDSLTFSIQNRPTWAGFNSSTGSISGSPTPGDEGTYANIRITVSDGSASASLPAFSISVTQTAIGTATLTWTAPTTNTDGTSLTDLTAYKIYYGTTPGSYPNSIFISNPGITSYVVENLTPATYQFVATAVNSAGVESVFSNVATKVVTN